MAHRSVNAKRALQIVGAVLAAAASIVSGILPSFESVTTDSSGHETITTQSLLQVQGPAFLVVLLIPVVVTLIPLFLRGRAWIVASVIVAALLVAFAIAGALSIGGFYLPAAVIETVATFFPVRGNRRTS
ncbi:hypothetical protein [Microbacterium sp. KR10-403]|uniref:hypothetical protein n=1 Tax=Microbacterium sp. KR10-403 TaxID=3158581 RepID=UPI0032E3CACB